MTPSRDRTELELGIRWFISDANGIGGKIRVRTEDFKVVELCTPKFLESLTKRPRVGCGTILLVERREIDTFAAVREVARVLGLTPQRVKIFGIKDKHAIVWQYAFVKRAVAAKASLGRVAFKVLGYTRAWPGARVAVGNAFDVVVRDVERPDAELVARVCAEMRERGCPNYFGHQRFGTRRPVTHLVGGLIVRREYGEAVWTYVALPSPYEGEEKFRIRKEIFEKRDPRQALTMLPRALLYEREMMKHLTEKPSDHLGALRRLPLRLRRLLVMAYQAYLFNKALSLRLERGVSINKPVAGDFVVDSGKVVRWDGRRKQLVPALQTIGYTYRKPEGIQREIDETVMEEEGVRPSMFHNREAPEFSLPSFFRPASMLPENLIYEVRPGDRIVRFSFTLPRGSFATVLLREFIKPDDVIEAGF